MKKEGGGKQGRTNRQTDRKQFECLKEKQFSLTFLIIFLKLANDYHTIVLKINGINAIG